MATLADLVVQVRATGIEAVQAATGRVRTSVASTASSFGAISASARRAASAASSALAGIAAPVRGAMSQLGSIVASALSPMGLLVAGVGSLGLTLRSMLSGAAALETMRVSFEVLLGSADEARKLIADINKFAAATPFEQAEIAAVAKQLLAAGIASEDVIDTTRMLGDIAALSGARLDDLAAAFGKVRQMGRLTAEVYESFASRGVPLARELAKQFGVTEQQVRELMSQGKIGFADVQNALAALTSEGGQFAGGMQRLSQTAAGLWSTLTGNVKQFLAETGLALIETLGIKDAIAAVAGVFDGLGARAAAALQGLRDQVAAVLGPAAGQLSAVVGSIWEGLQAIGQGLLSGLGTAVGPVLAHMGKVMALFQELAQWAGPILQQYWDTSVAVLVAGYEAVGTAIAAVVDWLSTAWSTIVEGAKSVFEWVLGQFGASPETVRTAITEWLASVQFFAENWRTYLQLAWERLKLFFSNLPEYAKTAFLNAVELVRWFADNWRDILQTAWNFAKTLWTNLGENIKRLWQAVLDYIAGRGWNFDWKPMLEGFQNTIKEMPNLVAANVQQTNEAIQRLEAELAKRRQEFDARRRQGPQAPGPPGVPGPVPPPAPRAGGQPPRPGGAAEAAAEAKSRIEFVGLTDLARKMQEAYGQKLQERMAKAQEKAAVAMGQVAGAVVGGAVQVHIRNAPRARFE